MKKKTKIILGGTGLLVGLGALFYYVKKVRSGPSKWDPNDFKFLTRLRQFQDKFFSTQKIELMKINHEYNQLINEELNSFQGKRLLEHLGPKIT